MDIRSFVGVHTNLSLLIRLLLNKQQIFLLEHQNDRAVTKAKPKESFFGRLPKLDLAKFSTGKELEEKLSRFEGYQIKTELD